MMPMMTLCISMHMFHDDVVVERQKQHKKKNLITHLFSRVLFSLFFSLFLLFFSQYSNFPFDLLSQTNTKTQRKKISIEKKTLYNYCLMRDGYISSNWGEICIGFVVSVCVLFFSFRSHSRFWADGSWHYFHTTHVSTSQISQETSFNHSRTEYIIQLKSTLSTLAEWVMNENSLDLLSFKQYHIQNLSQMFLRFIIHFNGNTQKSTEKVEKTTT